MNPFGANQDAGFGRVGKPEDLRNALAPPAVSTPFNRIEAELEACERLFWRVSAAVDVLLGAVPSKDSPAAEMLPPNGVLDRVEMKASSVGGARRRAQEQLDRLEGSLS